MDGQGGSEGMVEPLVPFKDLEVVPEHHAVSRRERLALRIVPDHFDDTAVAHDAHEAAPERHAGLPAPLHEITLEVIDVAEPHEPEPAELLMLRYQAFPLVCACFHGNHPFHMGGGNGAWVLSSSPQGGLFLPQLIDRNPLLPS